MPETPRAKAAEGSTPRAKPAVKKAKKKITAKAATMGMEIHEATSLTEESAKADLKEMQQKHQ